MTPKKAHRRRRRLSLLITLTAVMAIGSAGAYAYYTHRRERNTRKLLADAREAVAKDDWEEAVASYNLYLRRNPSDGESLSAYSHALLKRLEETPQVLGESLRVLRRVIQAEPSNPKPLANLTDVYLQLGEFAQAEELAQQWVNLTPDSTDALLALVRARHGLHKDAEAADILMQALNRRPTEATFYAPLIELLRDSLEKPEEASAWLTKALSAVPDSTDVQLAAFFHHQRSQQPDKAEAFLQRALELGPQDARVLVAGASFYLSRDELDEADRLIRRAEEAAPRHRAVMSARTAWALKQNHPDPLTATADELVAAAGSGELDLIARAGELYLRAGLQDRAEECIAKLAADPRPSEMVLAWLDTLRGAKLLMTGQPYPAITLLDRALRRQPQGLWAAELLALAYVQTGAADEAIDLYHRMLQAAPQLTAARLALARLELRRGHWDAAREQVQLIGPASGNDQDQADLVRIVCELRNSDGSPQRVAELSQALQHAAATPPANAATAELLLAALVVSGQPEVAVDVAVGFQGEASAARWLVSHLGQLLLAEKQTAAAERLADRSITRFPAGYEGHALRVRVLATTGRLQNAIAYVESGPLAAPALGKLWELLADHLLLEDRPQEAVTALQKALAILPNDLDLHRKLVRQAPSLSDALALVDEVRTLEGPDGVQWRFERAWALLRYDRARSAGQAIDLLRQCLALRPRWVSARVMLGSALEGQEAWDEAAEAYRAAIADDVQHATGTVAIRLIEALKRLGRFAEADAALTPLVAALPDSPEVLRLEMDKQLRNRSLTSAAAVAERILQLSGDDPAWAGVASDLQLRAGDAAKAEQLAREALTAHPDSISVATSLARAVIAQGRSEEAERLIRDFAARHDSGASHILLAQILVFLGQSQQAEEAIAAALARGSQDAAVVGAAADYYGSRGDRVRQLTHARRAIELRGQDPGESIPLATLLAGGSPEERAEATTMVRRVLSARPNDTPALLLDAQLAATSRPPDYAQAEKLAQKALSIDPRSVEAFKTLAAVQGRSGRIAGAEETVTAALSVAPDDPELLITSTQLQCHRGEYSQAITSLRRLLRIRPRMPEALRMFAAASRFAGQAEQAIAFIEQQAPPDQWTPLEFVVLAKLHEAKGDAPKAAQLFASAFERDSRSAEVFQEYVHFLARRGEHDQVYALASQRRGAVPQDFDSIAVAAELLGAQNADTALRQTAIEWLIEMAQAHPDRAADAYYRAGLCYYQAGDVKNAEDLLSRAAQREPMSPRPVNALAWLYCEKASQPQRGLTMLEEFLALGGTANAEMLDTHATILLRLGRLEPAKEKLIAALDLAGQTPTYTAVNFHLGVVLVRLKSADEGYSYLRQAVRLHQRVGGLSDEDLAEAQRLLADAGS